MSLAVSLIESAILYNLYMINLTELKHIKVKGVSSFDKSVYNVLKQEGHVDPR